MATCVVSFSQQRAPLSNELSGSESYRTYCASCHGIDGKGSGPAAAALRKAPPDLTLINKRNHGEFPAFRITHIIDGFEVQAAHGSREMPVWGDYFRDKELLELREHNLTDYLRSIQK
ncbi:MAG TPA: cytochrome c [Bryobacteraceae bacterium]|nr:cytochrome c [Bryobacteraceae bacterium]